MEDIYKLNNGEVIRLLCGPDFKTYFRQIKADEGLKDSLMNIIYDQIGKEPAYLPKLLNRAIKYLELSPIEVNGLINEMVRCQNVECLTYFRSYFLSKDEETKNNFDNRVFGEYEANPNTITQHKYTQLAINFNMQDVLNSIRPILDKESAKTLRPISRKEFWEKNEISNVPDYETLANFYVENLDSIKSLDTFKIQKKLTNLEPSNINCGQIVSNNKASYNMYSLPIDNNLQFVYHMAGRNKKFDGKGVSAFIAGDSQCFTRFTTYKNKSYQANEDTIYKGEQYKDPIKLWLNVKPENVPYVAQVINAYYNLHPEFAEEFKVDTKHQRNDIVTVYTYESYATDFINYIKQVEEVCPDLFEKGTTDNPFLMKIGDTITFAEIPHYESYPLIIAQIFDRLNKEYANQNISAKDAKLSILKQMQSGFLLLKNPYNMCSYYTGEGKRIGTLTEEEKLATKNSLARLSNKILFPDNTNSQ